MRIAIYAGSFDPITKGHLDILTRSAKMFDKVIIAVADNINKKSLLTTEDRKLLIEKSIKNIPNVFADTFDGLTINYAKKQGANFLIRGIRNTKDFESESEMAGVNMMLDENIETVFLISKPEFQNVSSSAVKEILKNNGDISKFVPEPVYKYFKKS